MIKHNTRRDAFHQILQAWLDESFDNQVGDAGNHAGPAWLWVRHSGEHFYLDASATRCGIRNYLRFVDAARGEVDWQLLRFGDPLRERVTIGPTGMTIEGFEFYRHVPRR
jgi:hypothetical protein